jgi:TolB-like protein/DNA-binding SARP family transcriptional activator
MLGPLRVCRDSVDLALPASRKVRGLLAYLALADRPVARSELCALLWDVTDDPRAELRWSLSKLRGIVDTPVRRRVRTRGELVELDLSDASVDALEVARAGAALDACTPQQLRVLLAAFAGDVLAGFDLDACPGFDSWLTAQRRRFRDLHITLLERFAVHSEQREAIETIERWLELAPLDLRPHELLLRLLASHNRLRDGEEHVAAAIRRFEADGLQSAPLQAAWHAIRGGVDTVPSARDERHVPARASIAVMPFNETGGGTNMRGGPSEALVHDIITRLAKLRSLFVIAQGTVFALHERGIGPEEAGRMLNVDYVASGSVRRDGTRLTVAVELVATRTAQIVWTETFDRDAAETLAVLDDLGNSIVSVLASEVEASERKRAVLLPPATLNAWEAYHRGLWHMYRFTDADNERARELFALAVQLDPTFARAYAGLSFTHFQNAFQSWLPRTPQVDRAIEAAGQSLLADDRDPAAHWAMGRALWLRGRNEASIGELQQAVDLSPNFALGHYTLAFVHSQAGTPEMAISASDYARHLSPFDPLLFGMFGARSMALVRLGRFDEAAESGVQAAARPNAHAHILAIAAYALALAGRLDDARRYLGEIRRRRPDYGVDDFLRAMQFESTGERLYREGARRIERVRGIARSG